MLTQTDVLELRIFPPIPNGNDGPRRKALSTASVLARPPLGVEQTLGRIIDHRNQGLPLSGTQRQPDVIAAIQVQQFAKAGARRTTASMAAPRAALAHQAGLPAGRA